MCGRFALTVSPENISKYFHVEDVTEEIHQYNIAPGQLIKSIIQTPNDKRKITSMKWGLIPSWTKDPSKGVKTINARAETVHTKPSFRNAIRYRRCIIPASGFYEWEKVEKRKVPYYIHLKSNEPIGFAGLWDKWKGNNGSVIESCTILTTSSNNLLKPIHDRMPVIIHPNEYELWLDREMNEPDKLKSIFQPYPSEMLTLYRISNLVNKTDYDKDDCIKPV